MDYIKTVVSYTTRPMRKGETNGKEHYFITESEAEKKLAEEQILAYTEIAGYKYFATKEGLNGANVYIIDPNGIEYLKSNKNIKYKVVYISTSLDDRISRCKNRSDFTDKFIKRAISEDAEFSRFEENADYDIIINNKDFDMSVNDFMEVVNETADDTLICVVGRTGSGKDSIVMKAQSIMNKNNNSKEKRYKHIATIAFEEDLKKRINGIIHEYEKCIALGFYNLACTKLENGINKLREEGILPNKVVWLTTMNNRDEVMAMIFDIKPEKGHKYIVNVDEKTHELYVTEIKK